MLQIVVPPGIWRLCLALRGLVLARHRPHRPRQRRRCIARLEEYTASSVFGGYASSTTKISSSPPSLARTSLVGATVASRRPRLSPLALRRAPSCRILPSTPPGRLQFALRAPNPLGGLRGAIHTSCCAPLPYASSLTISGLKGGATGVLSLQRTFTSNAPPRALLRFHLSPRCSSLYTARSPRSPVQ
ncbi:hypothetical protein K438DRAFT_272143 [Mycena galopus ATCC 62051]|nr:hypothetical protein K438DRAFT_272143 [Mycena galopus ATCC 62051]